MKYSQPGGTQYSKCSMHMNTSSTKGLPMTALYDKTAHSRSHTVRGHPNSLGTSGIPFVSENRSIPHPFSKILPLGIRTEVQMLSVRLLSLSSREISTLISETFIPFTVNDRCLVYLLWEDLEY